MAYTTTLASIPESRIPAFRQDQKESLCASRVIECSHLMAYWVQVQPLGALLGRAIDGGEPLDTNLWHSFRPPVFHRAAAVQEIYAELKRVWDSTQQELPLSEDDWYGMQIKEIVDLFGWAESRQEAVVSVLSLPFDKERASRIVQPRLD